MHGVARWYNCLMAAGWPKSEPKRLRARRTGTHRLDGQPLSLQEGCGVGAHSQRQCTCQASVALVAREGNDECVRKLLTNGRRCRQAIHARHVQVHQGEMRSISAVSVIPG